MTHPLTDEIISENFTPYYDYFEGLGGEICLGFNNDDMRAAYDLAIEHVYEIWNQLLEEVERDLTICWRFDRELSKMRPQQQEDSD